MDPRQNQNQKQAQNQNQNQQKPTANATNPSAPPVVENSSVAQYIGEATTSPHQYQSDEAAEAARREHEIDEDIQAPVPAEIAVEVKETKLRKASDLDKMVEVRPRRTIARMQYGQKFYQFVENKNVLVPRHLALHLREKGVI